jgi:hypothetical protein
MPITANTMDPAEIDTQFCIRIDQDHMSVCYSDARVKRFGTGK